MSESEQIVFESTKFGQVSIDRSSVLTFPHGLPGFERSREFGLVEVEEESPFLRLLSLEEPRLGFVLVDPTVVWPEYDPAITEDDMGGLEVTELSQVAIYCVVTLSDAPDQVTANLKGPICINTEKLLAKQLILVADRYHTKHALLTAPQEQ
jgi:flagellar assembly factor FliW